MGGVTGRQDRDFRVLRGATGAERFLRSARPSDKQEVTAK
jgi:hypothetical protein